MRHNKADMRYEITIALYNASKSWNKVALTSSSEYIANKIIRYSEGTIPADKICKNVLVMFPLHYESVISEVLWTLKISSIFKCL